MVWPITGAESYVCETPKSMKGVEFASTAGMKTHSFGIFVTAESLKNGGSEWGSNPPATGSLPPAGFEDRDDHRTACASASMTRRRGTLSVSQHRRSYFGCGTILRYG